MSPGAHSDGERREASPTASRVERLAARAGMTEGQAYTITIGLVVGLALALFTVPNIDRRAAFDEVAAGFGAPGGASADVADAPVAAVSPRDRSTVTGPTPPRPSGSAIAPVDVDPATVEERSATTAPTPTTPGDAGGGPGTATVAIAYLVDTAGLPGTAEPDVELATHIEHARFWVDEVNADGGVAGRTLSPVFVPYDSSDAASVRDACTTATEQHRAFWVAATSAAPGTCVAEEHDTLFSTSESMPSAAIAADGHALTWSMAGDRQLRGQAQRLHEDGALAGRTIGVVYSDRSVVAPAVEDGLLPRLRELGHEVAATTVLAGDETEADLVSEVAAMTVAGVDLLFLAAPADQGLRWVELADRVGFRPRYALSDVGRALQQDLAGYPASFEAVADSSSWGRHDWNAGRTPALPDVFEECRSRYRDATGVDVALTDSSSEEDVARWRSVMEPCRELLFFAAVAGAVEPELTTEGYVARVVATDLDRWSHPSGSTFGPEALDAADHVRPVRWQHRCPRPTGDPPSGCWTPTGPFSTVRS